MRLIIRKLNEYKTKEDITNCEKALKHLCIMIESEGANTNTEVNRYIDVMDKRYKVRIIKEQSEASSLFTIIESDVDGFKYDLNYLSVYCGSFEAEYLWVNGYSHFPVSYKQIAINFDLNHQSVKPYRSIFNNYYIYIEIHNGELDLSEDDIRNWFGVVTLQQLQGLKNFI